ncbi:MAG TPA: alanyl-tRNA editing protein [Vicinamibacteria bacterium]|nr:alanyl-tRNA editing protein [Vicinamibacteria bacterium]
MTERLFRDDPYLLEFDARIVGRRDHEGRPAVVLDRTAFYAESGGQPWDLGSLGEAAVVAVLDDAGSILHVLDRPLPGDAVHGRVDAGRRRDHRQQHHGQHLLSRAFVELADASRTTSFHLGAEVSTIDLDREVDEAMVRAAERRANEVVWEGRPVRVRVVSPAEAARLGVEPPEEAGDSVRLVDAEGFDLQACGGTHPRSTSEVGVVVVVGYERHKGGSRVRFVCGHRALEVFHTRERLLRDLAATFSSAFEDLPAAGRRAVEALVEGERQRHDLLERAMEGEAHRLLARSPERPAVVVATYEGWPAAHLRLLAQKVVAVAPSVALLGSRADKVHVVFAQSAGLGHDVPALLRQAVATLGGRGGGKGDLAQGGGDRPHLLEDALQKAARAVRGDTSPA